MSNVTGPDVMVGSGMDPRNAMLLDFLTKYEAKCPVCKYNLHGLTQPRCPECGNALRLSVGSSGYPLLWLVILLVAMCLSAGCGVLSGIVMTAEVIRTRRLEMLQDSVAVPFLFLGTFVSVFPAGLFALGARFFVRLPRLVQALFAAAAVCWDLLLILILVLLMFRVIR
jgi:hypothetical protein